MSSKTLDRYNVVLSGDDLPTSESEDDYFEGVEADLDAIAQSATGRAVLSKIQANGLVLILPYTDEYAKQYANSSKCNADSARMLPRGAGSRRVAQVHFSSRTFARGSPCSKGPGGFPDVALLHELVHAGRRLGFDFKDVKLSGPLARYDNEEDFFAILVENIYIAETGRNTTGLRANHGGTRLVSPDDDPEVFLFVPEKFALVRKYCDQETSVAPKIAKAKGEFNPIAVYYAWGQELPDAAVFHPKTARD